MLLVQMVYVSHTPDTFRQGDIASILESSKRNNAKAHITGALYFNKSYFLQCLEGSRAAVNKLYTRILLDDRHRDPTIVLFREIGTRMFDNWSMQYIDDDTESKSIFLRHSTRDVLDLAVTSGESCLHVLKELSELSKSKYN